MCLEVKKKLRNIGEMSGFSHTCAFDPHGIRHHLNLWNLNKKNFLTQYYNKTHIEWGGGFKELFFFFANYKNVHYFFVDLRWYIVLTFTYSITIILVWKKSIIPQSYESQIANKIVSKGSFRLPYKIVRHHASDKKF